MHNVHTSRDVSSEIQVQHLLFKQNDQKSEKYSTPSVPPNM